MIRSERKKMVKQLKFKEKLNVKYREMVNCI